MTNMSITDIANQAADKDFKWWVAALFAMLIIGMVMAIRYLVTRNEEQSKRFHESYNQNTVAQLEVAKTLAVCSQNLNASTQALERSSDLAEATTELIRETRTELREHRTSRTHA